ncbi:MAG TPA: 50S ribosomal protein L6 [Clostridia bacterium]
MSRIGRKPIDIPNGVTVAVENNVVTVKGPLGELNRKIASKDINIKIEDGKVLVSRANEEKETKALHGLYRTLINNMIVGVTNGYQKKLMVAGVGYKCQVTGSKLVLNIGFSTPVEVEIPDGIKAACPAPTEIEIKGIDKELVGQFAAKVRAIKKVEPYHGYGIYYSDERVIRKEGKKAAK